MAEPLGTNSDLIERTGEAAAVRARLGTIAALDLTRQIRAAERDGASPELAAAAAPELKRFLALPLLFPRPEAPFTPPITIDLLWHAFILDTRRYRDFCHEVYGGYLDHFPSEKREPEQEGKHRAFEYTLRCVQNAFGEVDQRVWKLYPLACDTCFGLSWKDFAGSQR
jgi:hypothetical protein